jgi:hypothetical protein
LGELLDFVVLLVFSMGLVGLLDEEDLEVLQLLLAEVWTMRMSRWALRSPVDAAFPFHPGCRFNCREHDLYLVDKVPFQSFVNVTLLPALRRGPETAVMTLAIAGRWISPTGTPSKDNTVLLRSHIRDIAEATVMTIFTESVEDARGVHHHG